jgi:hypothetical protein
MFYASPENFAATLLLPWTQMTHLGYFNHPLSVYVHNGAMPADESNILLQQIATDKEQISGKNVVYSLQQTSFSDNYGHYMIDDVLPNFYALHAWNMDRDTDVKMVNLYSCDLPGWNPYFVPQRSRRDVCESNLRNWAKFFFDSKPILEGELPHKLCMKTVITGHNCAFSLR